MIPKPPYCKPCELFGDGRGFSQVTGENRVQLLLVGEGSGRTEVREGKPFVGPSGQILEKALRISGLKREDYSITNLLRCGVPDNKLIGMPYERPALDYCRKYLNEAVAERRPKVILALGEVPLRELSAVHGSQAELRGYVLDSIYEGVKIIGTFHPSRILRGDWNLFGVLLHDLRRAVRMATYGVPEPLKTDYNLLPTPDQLRNYYDHLKASLDLLLSVDVETVSLLGQPESDNWAEKKLFQIQFSSAPGEAIVVPLTGEYVDAEFSEIVYDILALEQNKIGWNSRLSDEVVLKANGFKLGGEFYDGMAMFSHLQPGFASGKDAADNEDKGVSARLLNLQSAISFYFPWETPYKAAMRAGLHGGVVDMHEVRAGGAADSDLTLRVGLKLISSLKKQGLWEGYYRYKHRLGIVLSEMSERGLPIDKEEQQKLAAHIDEQSDQLEAELQAMIPASLRPIHPPEGYKGFPADLREAVKERGLWIKRCKPIEYPELAVELGYEIRTFGINGTAEQRLCKVLPFNAGSNLQILSYLQHQIDTIGLPWYIPLHIDTKKPTTNKAGMEGLIAATGDAALKQIEKCKKITKLKDYCHGKWEPEEDGRVHAEFRVGATATGQTTATNPPIQTYPKHFSKDDEWLVPTMKRIKSIIKAPPGHIMVETDMRGFHARMQGWLAEDAAYYRLANLDCHSFSTAHYVGVPDKDTMLQLDDIALMKRLKEIKAEYEYDRNFKLKRISFLNQYGGQAAKAATILQLPQIEVQYILDMIKDLFKPTFRDLPKMIEERLNKHPRLVTPFGFVRYIWDHDVNQAVAFWVASPAHCVIQDAVIRLHDRGALRRFNACNLIHDALWWCPKEEDADECIAVAHEEFEQASDVLVNSLGPFHCSADASKGFDMAHMVEA